MLPLHPSAPCLPVAPRLIHQNITHSEDAHTHTMGIFDSVRNNALKTKLRGELVLIDRQITVEKGKLGVALYDAIMDLQRKHHNTNKWPSCVTSDIKEEFEATKLEISKKADIKEAKELEVEKIAVNQERAPPPVTTQERASVAGRMLTSSASSTKLRVQSSLIGREIRAIKEAFGVSVFDRVVAKVHSSETSGSGGVKNAIKAGIGKIRDEDGIRDVLVSAKREMAQLLQQQESRKREITAIDQGVR